MEQIKQAQVISGVQRTTYTLRYCSLFPAVKRWYCFVSFCSGEESSETKKSRGKCERDASETGTGSRFVDGKQGLFCLKKLFSSLLDLGYNIWP